MEGEGEASAEPRVKTGSAGASPSQPLINDAGLNQTVQNSKRLVG